MAAAVDSVRVLTWNIRFILDRWFERRALVLQTLRDARPDIIGLQEVNIGGTRHGQHQLISSALGMNVYKTPACLSYFLRARICRWFFSSFMGQLFLDICAWFSEKWLVPIVCSVTTPNELFARPLLGPISYIFLGAAFTFGNALLTSRTFPATSHNEAADTLLLGANYRVASRCVVHSRGGRRVVVVNCHLQDGQGAHAVRTEQAQSILTWINSFCDALTEGHKLEMPCIIIGDFNGNPDENCMATFRSAGFKSAHVEAHGCEPSETFHQNHTCLGKDVGVPGMFDYIWMRGPIHVAKGATAVALVGSSAKPGDPTLWPSDHYGIVADLVLE